MPNQPPDKSPVEIPPLSRKIEPDEPISFVVGVSGPANEEDRSGHGFAVIVVDESSRILCRVPHRSGAPRTSQNRAALGAVLTLCDIIKRDEISGRATVRTAEKYLYEHLAQKILENYCPKNAPNSKLINQILGYGEIACRLIFERVADKGDVHFKQAKEMAQDARRSGGDSDEGTRP